MNATNRKFLRVLCLCLCLLCCLPLLAGCGSCGGSDEPVVRNAITSVTVGRGTQAEGGTDATLTVTAALTDALLKSYSGTVYLFELPARCGRNPDLRGLTPVADAPAASSLRFSLSLYDGMRSRLFSSFVLASYDKTARQYTVLTSAVAVSDPAVLADGTARTDAAVSVKGLSSPHPADAVRLGAASTVVDVSMGDIIREGWSEHAVSFLWNGVTFYYDGDAVRALDGTVSAYTAAGIRVYLRFLLKAPGESTPACLYVPGAGDAAGYSPNMTDPDAARLLEAFFRFMAERYAAGQDAPGRGLCASFLIGRGVNNVSRNAADGSTGASPDLHVSRYEQLVRLAHTALRASTSAGRVFICLDSHWNGRDLSGGFGAQNYLAAFRSEAALRGDFDWQIACELAASSPRVWLPSAADGDSLTIPSLSSLTDLLSAETYRTAGGSLRQVILTDYAIPSAFAGEVSSSDAAQADTYQASSFAYAYTVAAANPRVEALIYDGVADGAGLYAVSDGEPVRRPIGDTFAVIDTDGAESVLSVARPIVGTAFQRAESGQAGLALPTRTVTGSAAALPTAQMSSGGSSLLLGFDARRDNPLGGFTATEGLVYLDRVAVSGRPVLHAALEAPTAGMPVGVTAPLPVSALTGGRELLLDMQAAVRGDAPAGNLTATVLLTRVSKGTVASGDGTLRYRASSALPAGDWQILRCDISSFTSLLDPDDTVLLTVLLEGSAPVSCDLYLREARLTGVTAGSFPTVLILTFAGVATLALTGVVVFLFLRHRRRAR